MTAPRITLDELAVTLGGHVNGDHVLAPGPGHSEVDRSMSVKPLPDGGFVVHSFSGDDWRECRDWVIECVGLNPDELIDLQEGRTATKAQKVERARRIWEEGVDPRGTLVERYLAGRAIRLPEWACGKVLRYHRACPWRDEATGYTIYVPAMVAAMGSLETRELTGIHRTRLSPDGRKVDRRMLGVAAGSVIPIERLGQSSDLVIGEGVETCLSAAQFGFHPVWAVASAGAIRDFPVLHGIDNLMILAERDLASEIAIQGCRDRWGAAGRLVISNLPPVGNDWNDALRELSRG